ncbi:MAG TPA: MerR family transcriptional regulator [Acidimicrobiia bacterium]|nr:MerR family transcriptional regulator [Acidimicrobiia bacterium]
MDGWRIDELAQQSGFAVDTIRFYQREGLLPAGERRGRSVLYGPRHLDRLECIRALQARRFSLAAIKAIVDHEGPGVVALLAGREGAAYDHEHLVAAAGVPDDLVEGLEKVGLLRDPGDVGSAAYDADDVDVLRSFADLMALGVPAVVLVELARILTDGIEWIQVQTVALFQSGDRPEWNGDAHARFSSQLLDESPRVARDVRAIADYLQHRSMQHLVLRKLEEYEG